jgi:hypothetical protein
MPQITYVVTNCIGCTWSWRLVHHGDYLGAALLDSFNKLSVKPLSFIMSDLT